MIARTPRPKFSVIPLSEAMALCRPTTARKPRQGRKAYVSPTRKAGPGAPHTTRRGRQAPTVNPHTSEAGWRLVNMVPARMPQGWPNVGALIGALSAELDNDPSATDAELVTRAWPQRADWECGPVALGPMPHEPTFEGAFIAATGASPRGLVKGVRRMHTMYA